MRDNLPANHPDRHAAPLLVPGTGDTVDSEPLRSVPGIADDLPWTAQGPRDDVARRMGSRFDAIPDAIVVTDIFGIITDANAAARELLGSSQTGEPLSSLFGAGYTGLVHSVLRNTLEGRRLRPIQMCLGPGYRRQGALEASAAVRTDPERANRRVEVVWVFRDVSRWVEAAGRNYASARIERELGKLSQLAVTTRDPGIVAAQASESVKAILRWQVAIPAFGTHDQICEQLDSKLAGTNLQGTRIVDWPTLSNGALRTGRRVVVEDVRNRLRWVSSSSGQRLVTARRGALLVGNRSHVRGAIILDHNLLPRTFSQDGVAFLEAVAAVIEATYAAVDSRDKARRVAALEERNRLAMDIHDSLGQDFSGLVWELSAFRNELEKRGIDEATIHGVSGIADRARELLDKTRRTVWDMRTDPDIEKPLPECVEELLSRAVANRDIDSSFNVTGKVRRLQHSQGFHLLRIAQEAIGNAVSHSGCTAIAVELHFNDSDILLSVADDGNGFDPATVDQHRVPGRGMGLSNMRERVRTLAGRLEIDSAPAAGATVRVTCPAQEVTNVVPLALAE